VSDFLFPHVGSRPALQLKLAALAAVVAVLFAAGSAWLGLSLVGVAGRDVPLTARVTTLGDSLGVNSSVKFRGLRVGRVVTLDDEVAADGTHTAHIVLLREYAGQVPRDVVARVLPGTIFGAEYIDLTPRRARGRMDLTAATTGPALAAGDEIPADTSAATVRLMDTFAAAQRVFGAVDPATLDAALSQLATALDGHGRDLRAFIGRADRFLRTVAANEPTFYADLDLLARNLDTVADLEPSVAQTLRNSLPVARTISARARARELAALARGATVLADSSSGFLERHTEDVAALLDALAPTYRAFVRGVVPFEEILRAAPGLLHNGATAIRDGAIQMIAYFGATVFAPYSAADCPRYGHLAGGNCR
jgi:virulence factor Mce-like protein